MGTTTNENKKPQPKRQVPLNKERFLTLARDIEKIVAKEQKAQHAK